MGSNNNQDLVHVIKAIEEANNENAKRVPAWYDHQRAWICWDPRILNRVMNLVLNGYVKYIEFSHLAIYGCL